MTGFSKISQTVAVVCLAAIIAVIPEAGAAKDKESTSSSSAVATVHRMKACVLRPFDRLYVDVAAQEKGARQKVSKRCQKTEGEWSIFCKEEKAECSTVSVKIPK